MEVQYNPFQRSFEDSKGKRLHYMQMGLLSDCEFLVGDDIEVNNNNDDNEDINVDSETNKGSNNSNQNASGTDDLNNDLKVTPNPNEIVNENDVDDINVNMQNCKITGPKLFRCHKMLLALTSEVFERMFYGGFDDQPSPIRVSDISPDIFEIFINYIYTYELEPHKVTMKNFSELLYIAEKYMLKEFSKRCVDIIKQETWEQTDILPMFELACLYDNNDLFLLCQEKICENAEQLLKDDTFYQLNINFLGRLMILLTEHGNVKLIQLLTALERYGRINKLCEDRQAENFIKLVNAACNLNYGEMDAQAYASGPGVSYLFANKYDDVILL